MAYKEKAIIVSQTGDHAGAIQIYDQSIEIWHKLVYDENRSEVADSLAISYLNKGIEFSLLGDKCSALQFFDYAIAIRDWLVNHQGRSDLIGSLALTRSCRGFTFIELGDKDKGFQDTFAAQNILMEEIKRTDQSEHKEILIKIRLQLMRS